MNRLNTQIRADTTHLGPGFVIGHSFFVPSDGVTCNEEWLSDVIEHEIKPLVYEYWSDRPDKADDMLTVFQSPA